MSLAARGVYDTLWMESWFEKEPGVLPNNDVILAGLGQCTLDEWNSLKHEVLSAFDVTRDTCVTHSVTREKQASDSRRDAWRKRQQAKRNRERDKRVTSPNGSSTGSSLENLHQTDSLSAPANVPPARHPEAAPNPGSPTPVGGLVSEFMRQHQPREAKAES